MAKKPYYLRGAFGNAILTQRKRAGLSAQGLADILEVDRKTVVKWENEGTIPYPKNWEKLVKWAENNTAVDENSLKRAYAKALMEYGVRK